MALPQAKPQGTHLRQRRPPRNAVVRDNLGRNTTPESLPALFLAYPPVAATHPLKHERSPNLIEHRRHHH